jgi:hypothetical protein
VGAKTICTINFNEKQKNCDLKPVLLRIRNLGSGMEKIRIRDQSSQHCLEPYWSRQVLEFWQVVNSNRISEKTFVVDTDTDPDRYRESGFNGVLGSESGFAIRIQEGNAIRIQEGKSQPQKYKKLINFIFW